MIGTLRLILALGVLCFHLNPGFAHFSGPIAVFGFYTVSGYLIARILRTTYRDRLGAFILNRALRIYPSYFAAAALGLVAALATTPLNTAIQVPATWADAWRQVTVLGLQQMDFHNWPVRLVPPAWSLSVELAYYLAMPILVLRPGWWLGVSVPLAGWFIISGDFAAGYGSYLAPSFCFALGAFVQAYGLRLDRRWSTPAFLALFAAFVLGNLAPWTVWVCYPGSLATAAILASADVKIDRWRYVDRWCGELAYPLFLVHWACASIIGGQLGWRLMIETLPLALAVSVLLVIGIEQPIARLRNRVRGKPTPQAAENVEGLATQPAT